jgi:glycine/D-amino acid oxidase-like deaminating enzyme
LPRAEQGAEIDSGFYHGGLVFPDYATLHPGTYHRGLLHLAERAGASIIPHCRADAIRHENGKVEVETTKGIITARDVIVATNGYTSSLTPWLQRRVIPIGSYVIATEPLAKETIEQLYPNQRMVTDSRRVVFYYGPSPDRRRIIFGGRVSAGECDPKVSGPRLHAEMVRIFPELATTKISHSWMGFVAYTFDELAHVGTHDDRVHYAMGYCGSGVGMASYLGMRTGLRVLGQPEGKTALDDLPFPTRPLYSGKPWFLSAAVAWYRWRDRRECDLAARQIKQQAETV